MIAIKTPPLVPLVETVHVTGTVILLKSPLIETDHVIVIERVQENHLNIVEDHVIGLEIEIVHVIEIENLKKEEIAHVIVTEIEIEEEDDVTHLQTTVALGREICIYV